MFISVTNKNRLKAPLIRLGIALGCIAVANIYAVFGHGIRSDAMDYMFVYPLLGGAVVYFIAGLIFERSNHGGTDRLGEMPGLDNRFRLGANLYNAGIATLTAGAMLRGILEIAGTGSSYAGWFTIGGWLLIGLGIIIAVYSLSQRGSFLFSRP